MMRTRWQRTLTGAAAACAAALVYCQQPFMVDDSFVTNIEQVYVNDVFPLVDGRIVFSGRYKYPGDISFRSGGRLFSNGTADLSFPLVAYMGGKITQWSDKYYVGNGDAIRRLNDDWLLDM